MLNLIFVRESLGTDPQTIKFYFMNHYYLGLAAVFLLLFSSCENDEVFNHVDDFVVLQSNRPVKDTIPICEQQIDSLFYWDDGYIGILLPPDATATATIGDSTSMEMTRQTPSLRSISFPKQDPRTQRDSVANLTISATFANGKKISKHFTIQWRGITIPDSLWQRITLEPAKISKISMYPGEKRSVQFVWNYPKELRGLLTAQVANQKTGQSDPDWKAILDVEKKKYTSSWVYGQNETARFRIVGREKVRKEVYFAVVSNPK